MMIASFRRQLSKTRREWQEEPRKREALIKLLPGSHVLSVFGGQGAISLQSFVCAIVMIRNGTPGEFGLYTAMLAGINFIAALQVAVVVGPLLVLAPGLPLARQRSFTASLLSFNLFLSAAISLFALLVYEGFRVSGAIGASHLKVLLAGIAYLLIYQAQEFFRRVLQIHQEFVAASICDIATLILVLALALPILFAIRFLGLTGLHFILDAVDGLLLLVVSALVGLLMSIYKSRHYITFAGMEIVTSIKEAWTIGGWSAVVVFSDLLFTYSSTWIVAGVAGTAAVGHLEAPRLLVAPIQVFSNAIRSYLIPTVSALVATGARIQAASKLKTGFLWTTVLVGTWCLIVTALPVTVVRKIFGPGYEGSSHLLAWWAGSYFFMSINAIPWIAVLVARRVRISALVMFVLGCGVTAGTWIAAHHGTLSDVLAVRAIANCLLVGSGIWLGNRYLYRTKTDSQL